MGREGRKGGGREGKGEGGEGKREGGEGKGKGGRGRKREGKGGMGLGRGGKEWRDETGGGGGGWREGVVDGGGEDDIIISNCFIRRGDVFHASIMWFIIIGVQVLTGGFNGSEPDDCTGMYVHTESGRVIF